MLFVIVGSNFLFHNFKAPTNPDAPISNGDSNNNNDNNSNNNNNDLVTPPVPDDSNLGDYELSASENFVYSLIYADLTKQYDTFIGYVPLTVQTKSNGLNPAATTETVTTETYGISYVDYEEAYIDENGKTYFSAGFISFPNEPTITESNIENGLEIISLEEETDEQFSYVYTYNTEDVHMHCIIDNKYVKYDIVDGTLQYQEEPFVEGMEVDDSRGNIYSYDIEDYVYIIEEIDYVPVSGVSIVGEADYQAIMDEVNRILETQEANFTYAQIEQFISHSQDALISYLLGLQEETFFGYATTELIETAKNLDPMQHLQIGVDENGNTTINLIEVTKKATLWEKICTSVICVGAMVGGIALSIVGSPVLGGAAGGMIIGAAMEAFSQVVLYDTPTSDIQWAQVGVAAVAGALAGASSGYLSGIATKGFGQLFIREATDLLCDGFIGGTEFFVNSLIGGATFEEAVDNFGAGLTAGVVLGSIFKIGSTAVKEAATLVKKTNTSPYIITKVNNEAVKKAGKEAIENGLSETQEKAIQKATKESAEDALTPSIKQLQQKADNTAKIYNKKYRVAERAKLKGITGITETPNGGISFKGTDYVYKLDNGKEAIHTIKATGDREKDFEILDKIFQFKKRPKGYTWHHLDDFNVETGEMTLELVKTDIHRAINPHSGGCAQYDVIYGPSYNK